MQTTDTLDRAIAYANHVGGIVCALSGQVNGYDVGHRRAVRGWWHAVMRRTANGADMLAWWPEDDDSMFKSVIGGAAFVIASAPYTTSGRPNRIDDARSVTDESNRDLTVWYVAGWRTTRTPDNVTRPLPGDLDDSGAVFLRRMTRALAWDMPRNRVYFLTLTDHRSIHAVEWVWNESGHDGQYRRRELPDRLAGIGHRSDPFARDLINGKVV